MFNGMRMQPVGLFVFFTFAPKGHKQSKPILKVCNATGMPTIVHTIAKLAVKYPSAASKPPNSHHSKLPRIFIFLVVQIADFDETATKVRHSNEVTKQTKGKMARPKTTNPYRPYPQKGCDSLPFRGVTHSPFGGMTHSPLGVSSTPFLILASRPLHPLRYSSTFAVSSDIFFHARG